MVSRSRLASDWLSPILRFRLASGLMMSVSGDRMSCVALMRNFIFSSSNRRCVRLCHSHPIRPKSPSSSMKYRIYASVERYHGARMVTVMVFSGE